jgi:cytosine/adenosine deaminase-related metal-dependent hydrolase
MQLRKIRPEKLFDGRRMLEQHALIISSDGTIEAVVPDADAGDDVEPLDGLLTPGFINCHCHLELSHMKGTIPEKTGLVDFVFKVVTERKTSDNEILQAIADAESEMKKAGIVAVGDICNNELTLPQKQKRNLHYYNFIEASGWLPSVSETRFERAKAIYDVYSSIQNSTFHIQNTSMGPHAPYSVSKDLWKLIQPYFQNKVVSIHNQETVFEDEFFLKGTGDFKRMYELMKIDNAHHLPTKKSSLQSYFSQLSSAEKIILVHNTFTKQEDIEYVENMGGASTLGTKAVPLLVRYQPKTFFCLCINANLYIENALPPIELLRRNHCAIVLGTDSLASNWSLSIANEMKTVRKHFPHVHLNEILGWATLNGAEALGMDHLLGTFEKGKKPGAVLLSEETLDVINTLF